MVEIGKKLLFNSSIFFKFTHYFNLWITNYGICIVWNFIINLLFKRQKKITENCVFQNNRITILKLKNIKLSD